MSQAQSASRLRFGEQVEQLTVGHDYVEGELLAVSAGQVQRVKVDASRIKDEYDRVRREYRAEEVELNYTVDAQSIVPDDPYFEYQWNFEMINVPDAWDESSGQGVVVAVVDSGVKAVQDLKGTEILPGYDFVEHDDEPDDENGHGTHITGTIAQSTNNNYGTAGIAYNAEILPIKVLDRRGRGSYFDVYDGIIWAVDHGADVINLSLGGKYPSRTLREAVKYAHDQGVIVVAAAGNSGDVSNGVIYPATYDDYVIAVGAVRYDQTRADYSNGGESLDFVAPGGDLSVDQNQDGFGDGILQETIDGFYFYQGTSMASAHMTGLVAMLFEHGKLGFDQTIDRLKSASVDLGEAGRDDEYGYGLVMASNLFTTSAQTSPTLIPTVTPSTSSGPSATPLPSPTLVPTLTPTPIPPTQMPTNTLTIAPTATPTPTSASENTSWICRRYPWLRYCQR